MKRKSAWHSAKAARPLNEQLSLFTHALSEKPGTEPPITILALEIPRCALRVCEAGHIIGSEASFCDQCKAKVLCQCPQCNSPILLSTADCTVERTQDNIKLLPPSQSLPNFCGQCGYEFPWSALRRRRARLEHIQKALAKLTQHPLAQKLLDLLLRLGLSHIGKE